MSSIETRPRASVVSVREDELSVRLVDGRTVSVPLSWFPRLLGASADQRCNFRLIGNGEGIRWPDVDEDLSVAGLLAGWHSPATLASTPDKEINDPLRTFPRGTQAAGIQNLLWSAVPMPGMLPTFFLQTQDVPSALYAVRQRQGQTAEAQDQSGLGALASKTNAPESSQRWN